jgi:hypothetical protein
MMLVYSSCGIVTNMIVALEKHVHSREMGSRQAVDKYDDDDSVASKFSSTEKGDLRHVQWFRKQYPYNGNDDYFFSDYVSDVHGQVFSSKRTAINFVVPRLLSVVRQVYDVNASIVVKVDGDNRIQLHDTSLLEKYAHLTYSCHDTFDVVKVPILDPLDNPVFGIASTDQVSNREPDTSIASFLSKLKEGEIPIDDGQLPGYGIRGVYATHVHELYTDWVSKHAPTHVALNFDSFIQSVGSPFGGEQIEWNEKPILQFEPDAYNVSFITTRGITAWRDLHV